MKIRNSLILASLASLAVLSAPAQAEYTQTEIEKIIHDYIINNPDVLIEASAIVMARQKEIEDMEKQQHIASISANKMFPQSGPAKADHVIIEFFDYNCGYCKKAKPLLIDLLKEHKDTRYIYMELPILSKISYTAAKIGIAIYNIDRNKYVEYNNKMMTRSSRLNDESEIKSVVESIGLDWEKVNEVAKKPEVDEVISAVRKEAEALKVNGTPAFIVDGEALYGAPMSKEQVLTHFKKKK